MLHQLPRSEAIHRLGQHPEAWVRVAAVRQSDADPWKLRLLEITTGAPPPRWEVRLWEYPAVILHSYALTGPDMKDMLTIGSVRAGTEMVEVAPQGDTVSSERRPSRARHGPFEPLDWPSVETRLSLTEFQQNEPVGDLLSDSDAPSFASFYYAAAWFFWGVGQVAGGQINPESVHRHQDRSGRFNIVRVIRAEDVLEVELEGEALDGLTVELAGGMPGPRMTVEVPAAATGPFTHKVTLDLLGGVRPGAWLVLRHGSQWFDRRNLASSPWWQGDEDVEVVEDQATRLEALVGAWEREQVEFKRQVPGNNDRDSKLKVMKTVCAFANGQGGSVLIGVDDDDRSYVGVDPRALDSVQRQLDQMVRSWVEPAPVTHFDTLPIPGSDQVILEMAIEGGTTLYVCGQPGETRRPYVRHHSSTEVANRNEILAITQRNAQPAVPIWNRS